MAYKNLQKKIGWQRRAYIEFSGTERVKGMKKLTATNAVWRSIGTKFLRADVAGAPRSEGKHLTWIIWNRGWLSMCLDEYMRLDSAASLRSSGRRGRGREGRKERN